MKEVITDIRRVGLARDLFDNHASQIEAHVVVPPTRAWRKVERSVFDRSQYLIVSEIERLVRIRIGKRREAEDPRRMIQQLPKSYALPMCWCRRHVSGHVIIEAHEALFDQ